MENKNSFSSELKIQFLDRGGKEIDLVQNVPNNRSY